MISAQVHRFHNNVAIYVGSGETVYLSPAQAHRIARALNAGARDIELVKFTDSTLSTVHLTIGD